MRKKRIALIGAIPIICCLLYVIGYSLYMPGASGFVKSELDLHLVPTAEALIQNPMRQTGEYTIRVIPSPGSTICNTDTEFVTVLVRSDRSINPLAVIKSQLLVNNQSVPWGVISSTEFVENSTPIYSGGFHRLNQLESGLHLFELRIPDTFFFFITDYSYTWAYQITDECEPEFSTP